MIFITEIMFFFQFFFIFSKIIEFLISTNFHPLFGGGVKFHLYIWGKSRGLPSIITEETINDIDYYKMTKRDLKLEFCTKMEQSLEHKTNQQGNL